MPVSSMNKGRSRIRAGTTSILSEAGATRQLTAPWLKAPVAFAKASGATNITLSSTGLATTTAAIAAGATQSIVYTATGADGEILTRTLTLLGVAGAVTLGALTLSASVATVGSAITINILGATAGSTLTVVGSLPAGLTLDSGARTITGTPTSATTGEFQLRETLAGATNSPRTSDVFVVVSVGAQLVAPSASYNGTAGSGWTGGTEPVRSGTPTTQSAVVNYMDVPAAITNFVEVTEPLAFVDDVTIAVEADAFMSDGSPGIEKVIFFVEGTTVEVTQQVPISRVINGETRTFMAYAIALDHSAWPVNGAARIWARAVPTNPSIQARTIGPLIRRRKTTLWDLTIRIRPGSGTNVPGSVYFGTNALRSAIDWARQQNATLDDVRIQCDGEAFIHEVSQNTVSFPVDSGGNVLVEAINGGTITVRHSLTDAFVNYNFRCNGLILGQGVTINVQQIGGLTKDVAFRPYYFAPGMTVCSNGPGELTGGTGIIAGANNPRTFRTTAPIGAGVCISMGCTWRDMYFGPKGVMRSLWDTSDNIGEDFLNPLGGSVASLVGQPTYIKGHRALNSNTESLRDPIAAMALRYTGAGVATVAFGDAANSASRTLSLRVNGTQVRLLTASTTPGSGIHTFADAVADINANLGGAGWVATLIDNSRRFASVGGLEITGEPAQSPAQPVAIGATDTSLTAWFDVHGDFCQFGDATLHDNVIISDCEVVGVTVDLQVILAKNRTDGFGRNILIVNLSVELTPSISSLTGTFTQFSGNYSHFLLKNITCPNQRLFVRGTNKAANLRFTPDEFSGMWGCVYRGQITESGNNVGSFVMRHNTFIEEQQIADNGTTRTDNVTAPGQVATLFTGHGTGNMRPAGVLLTQMTPRFTAADMYGRPRSATTLKGAALAA